MRCLDSVVVASAVTIGGGAVSNTSLTSTLMSSNVFGSEVGRDVAAVDGNEETVEICTGSFAVTLELLLVIVAVAFTRRTGGLIWWTSLRCKRFVLSEKNTSGQTVQRNRRTLGWVASGWPLAPGWHCGCSRKTSRFLGLMSGFWSNSSLLNVASMAVL